MYSWIQDMLLRVLWGGLSQFEFLRGFSSGSNLTVNWGKRVPTNGKSNSNAKIYLAMEPKLQLLPKQRRNKKKKIEKIVFLAVGKKTDRSHIWQRNVLLDVLEPGSWCHSGPQTESAHSGILAQLLVSNQSLEWLRSPGPLFTVQILFRGERGTNCI